MKRVRTKETIENNRKLSKKQDESDHEIHPSPIIPLDLIIEILLKVPAKSVGRFAIVSKQWLSIIRSKDFTKLYLTQSSTRPRLLFSVYRRNTQAQFFHSCSQFGSTVQILKIAMKKRGRKSKKGEEKSDENDPCSILPLDLKVEILLKLVPETIARLGFVSNHWSSIIRGKEFTDLYLTRSLAQPRLLFSVYHRNTQIQFFHSCSQEDPSSDHRRVSYTLKTDLPYRFSPPIRGLIFGLNDTKALIGNPSTGQFVSLPRIKTRRKDIFSVFGYDPVNDLYKVLCMTVITRRGLWENHMWEPEPMSEEHQVFTLGAKQKWRMIDCKYLHRHYPKSQGICRNGVLYYLASFKDKRSLISFDLRSEEFDVTKLPEDYMLILVNHTGKITIASNANSGPLFFCYDNSGPLDLWVLEDASKGEWSKVAAVVPSFADIVANVKQIAFCGILPTGEIIIAPLRPIP